MHLNNDIFFEKTYIVLQCIRSLINLTKLTQL